MMISPKEVETLVHRALAEDIGTGDITSQLLPAHQTATASVITREDAILCGTAFVNEVYRQLDPTVTVDWLVKDSESIIPNQLLCELKGPLRSLLSGERTALNFLQSLSGTATVTRQYVDALKNSAVQLLDTRKTIPLLRKAQKYAVRCGGGKNHRLGLYDAYLIKENHIAACGSIQQALTLAKQQRNNQLVEIEVESLEELEQALNYGADIVLLDNFSLSMIREAVRLNAKRAKLEVSGNVTLKELPELAATGIDYISVGALTKHLQAIDLSMRLHPSHID